MDPVAVLFFVLLIILVGGVSYQTATNPDAWALAETYLVHL
jgi:hypothetical protein